MHVNVSGNDLAPPGFVARVTPRSPTRARPRT
jgi:hypothetical protein